MPYVALTIFDDAACTVVRNVVHLEGINAVEWLSRAKRLNGGWDVREGQTYFGCRVDRIGSEGLTP